tara:strand:+ start:1473 stop:2042 length:570 start_codon:yes stop_codon:yes gene_type:complete
MSESVLDAIKAESEKFADLTTEGGSELSDLIAEANKLKGGIEDVEEQTKKAKAQLNKYLFELIPAKMAEMGLDKVEADGHTVSLKQFVSATMPKDPTEKAMALQYLRDIGKGDFIKNDVSISFGVSEDAKAVSLQAELEGNGFQTTAKTWVEPQTLKKMLRESIENGETVDLERFNAYLGTTAVIKGVK